MSIQLIPSEEVISISKWIPITKSYKYVMKSTKNQEVKLNQTLNTCRRLYNDILGERDWTSIRKDKSDS